MADVWFVIVCVLLVGYVVLDGFDFGAGVLHRIVAAKDSERREVIAAIGPFWDGNEVFLLAAGGALFLAFSRVLAAGLSGLYLAVMLVLWGILLRGISLELRSHLRDSMWRAFWDVVFQLASGLLALLLGVALGCVLRGFPIGDDGYFGLELFSFESPTRGLGVIDAYTLFTGLFALLLLTQHGGRFLAMRTTGEVAARSKAIAQRLTIPVAIAWAVVTGLTYVFARPAATTFAERPWAWPIAVIAAGAMYLGWHFGKNDATGRAFLASCATIVALLGVAATSMYPVLLRSTTDAPALDVTNAANPEGALGMGLRWWFFAFALVVAYFVNLARIHRGPATTYGEGGDQDAEEPGHAHDGHGD